MCGSKNWGGGGVLITFFSHHCIILQRDVQTSLQKQFDPMAPIASGGKSGPEFIRTPIASCDFTGVV